MFEGDNPQILQAYETALATFKYFWRELSWERRRIVPGLDMAAVKLPFTDGPRRDGNPEFEHMWAGDVDFDGLTITARLLNQPNWLTSVQAGQTVQVPVSHLEDWLLASGGRTCGGFTVNAMRAAMSPAERADHDAAWGMDFGDPASPRIELHAPPGAGIPAAFEDHPMCLNMAPKYQQQLSKDTGPLEYRDGRGWSLLHSEALAGNVAIANLLLQFGAHPLDPTPDGRTSIDLARQGGWPEVAAWLSDCCRS